MPNLLIEDYKTIELVAQTNPTTIAQHETVTMNLPVISEQLPDLTFQIQVRMTMEQAQYLAGQIPSALMVAKNNLRLRGQR